MNSIALDTSMDIRKGLRRSILEVIAVDLGGGRRLDPKCCWLSVTPGPD